jgi:hypothetical protein
LAPFEHAAAVEIGFLANHDGATLVLLLRLVADAPVLAVAVATAAATADQSPDHFGHREFARFVMSVAVISLKATTLVNEHFKSLV